jgi:hypothetical protein
MHGRAEKAAHTKKYVRQPEIQVGDIQMSWIEHADVVASLGNRPEPLPCLVTIPRLMGRMSLTRNWRLD